MNRDFIKQLVVLSCVIFSEPLSLTILYPFMVPMIKSFNLSEDVRDVGFYAGFIAAAFPFAQFLTSIFWGQLSNRIGRKPVILFGLFGNVLTSILFGVSKSFTWALVCRFACGFLNGNIGVAKCVLGEISDDSTQTIGFSIFGLLFGIGSLLGSAIGGLLAEPAAKYPRVFGGSSLFAAYPYLLPCLVSATVSLVGFIIGLVYFKESLHNRRRRRQGLNIPVGYGDDEVLINPRTSLSIAQSLNRMAQASNSVRRIDAQQDNVSDTEAEYLQSESQRLLGYEDSKEVTDGLFHSAISNVNADDDEDVLIQSQLLQQQEVKSGEYKWRCFGANYAPVMTIMAYILLAFITIIFQEVYILYCQTDEQYNGLGWSSSEVGISMAMAGVLLLLFQIFVYPWAEARRRRRLLFRDSLLVQSAVIFVTAFLTDAKQHAQQKYGGQSGNIMLWSLTAAHHMVRVAAGSFSFTTIMVMINNSATLGSLGLINGISQSLASLVRAIGPVLGGIMYQYSLKSGMSYPLNHHLVFVTLSLLSILAWIQSMFIPPSAEQKQY
ncbi:hypothetical protein MP228_003700 [Amoeboaphelidium protococcarum]|nr:hypothetical protein MP228_003700 [Amoeboaphelidium protococcarum]